MHELETIDIDLLILWTRSPRLYTQHWDGKKKILKFFNYAPNGICQVKIKDKVVYEGGDMKEAVEVYNNL